MFPHEPAMRTLRALLLLLALGFVAGCNNGTDAPPRRQFVVAYFVETTGGAATVTQIDWVDSNGNTVTVTNPTLPFTSVASFNTGGTPHLVVAGSTGAASTITGRIQDDPAFISSPVTYAETTCPENTATCAIDLQHTF